MALGATVHRFELSVSDVDRGVYEALDVRTGRHPSESLRYMLLRVFAYALSYEEGIAFSKGGLSDTDEPPLAIRGGDGVLLAWIDVGLPSAERLHKASKAARRVDVYTAHDVAAFLREAQSRPIHRASEVGVFRVEPALVDAIEPHVERHTKLELTRTDGRLYVTIGGKVLEGAIDRVAITEPRSA
jgi:uncharacterized protein YaeQ